MLTTVGDRGIRHKTNVMGLSTQNFLSETPLKATFVFITENDDIIKMHNSGICHKESDVY